MLALLTTGNRLACRVALHTGLRIGDVLSIRTRDLGQRMTVTESKTKKRRRVHLPAGLLSEIREHAGAVWAFPGRLDESKHRCRQTVWSDLRRARRALRLPETVGTHSMRKIYAVKLMKRYGDLNRVQRALGHDNETTTMLYAMADQITARHIKKR